MPRKSKPAPGRDELSRRMEGMSTESDRGFGLTVAAWIDDALGEVIRSRFINAPSAADELLTGDSPLATFSARIKLLYCLGLIGESVKRDLNVIRGIRNDFAHDRDDITFASPSVRDRCAALRLFDDLKFDKRSKPTTPRAIFMVVGLHLVTFFMELADASDRPSLDPDVALAGYLDRMLARKPRVGALMAWAKAKVEEDRMTKTGE